MLSNVGIQFDCITCDHVRFEFKKSAISNLLNGNNNDNNYYYIFCSLLNGNNINSNGNISGLQN